MSFERGVVIFLAMFVALAGVASFASPASLAQQVGWTASGAGLTEVRAFYGGLQVGLGCFLLWCSRDRDRLLAGLLLAGFAVGGIGIARAIGLVLDGTTSAYHLGNLMVELTTVAVVAIAVSVRRRRLAD